MKKLALACSAFLLMLSSCSSSSDSNSSSSDDVLVSKTIETYALDGSVVTSDYTYSGKKLVQETDDDGVITKFTYTGDLITKVEYFDDLGVLVEKETFSYDSSSKLISYVRLELFNNDGIKDTFVYNSNGTVTGSRFSGDLSIQDDFYGTSIIYFTNNEVSKIEEYSDVGDLYATRLYTYDTKVNPFKNIIGFDKIQFVDNEALGINHNIVTDDYTDSGLPTPYTTTYTYNANNFPLTAVESGGDPSDNISTEYIYQ